MTYMNNEDTDQPVQLCSLISVFVICSIDSTIPIDSIPKVSRLELDSVTEQASLSPSWLETAEDMTWLIYQCFQPKSKKKKPEKRKREEAEEKKPEGGKKKPTKNAAGEYSFQVNCN